MDLLSALLAIEVLVFLIYYILRQRDRFDELARSLLALFLPLVLVAFVYVYLPSQQEVEAAYEQLERAFEAWSTIYVYSGIGMTAMALMMDLANLAMLLASFGITVLLKAAVSAWTMARLNPLFDFLMTINGVAQAFMMISRLLADVVWYARYAWPMLLVGYALIIPRRIRVFGALLIVLAIALLLIAKIGGEFAWAAVEKAEEYSPDLRAALLAVNSTPIAPNAAYYINSPTPTLLLTSVKTSWDWIGMLDNAIRDASRYEFAGCNFTAPQLVVVGVVNFFRLYGEYNTTSWTDIAGHIWHIYRYGISLDVAQEALNRAWRYGSHPPCGLPRIYYDRLLGVGAAIINGTWRWAPSLWRPLYFEFEDWGIAAPQPLVNRSWLAAFTPAATALSLGKLAIEYPKDRGVMIINWLDYNATLTAVPVRPLRSVMAGVTASSFNLTEVEDLQNYVFNASAPFGAWRAYEIALPPPPWWLLTPAENAVYDWDMIYGWAWHASGKPTGVMGSFDWLYPPSAATYPNRTIWYQHQDVLALKASYGKPDVVNFTVMPQNATLYYYNVTIQLRHWREVCTWWACAQWANGTCTQWEQRTTSRPIDEKYRLEPREITLTYNYNLTLYWAPWRTTWTANSSLTGPFNYTLVFKIPAINYSVVKYNEIGDWSNGLPPSNASCSIDPVGTTTSVVKAVRPVESYTAIAAWAWLNNTRLAFNAPPAPPPPERFNESLVWPRPLQAVVCKHNVLNLDVPPVAERIIALASWANSTVYSLNYNISRIYALEERMWRGALPSISISPSALNFLNPELPKITVFQLFSNFSVKPFSPPVGYSLFEPHAVCVIVWLLPRGYNATGIIELYPASPWRYYMPIAYTPEMERLIKPILTFALTNITKT